MMRIWRKSWQHQHMINAYDNMVKNGLHEAYEKEKNYGQD